MNKEKFLKFLKKPSTTYFFSLLICIVIGVIVGFVVILSMNAEGAGEAIGSILGNFLVFGDNELKLKYLGSTLVKTAPLVMCALSVVFAKKVGMFNIGVAGQYVIGACMSIFAAIVLNLPWYLCILIAMLSAGAWGALCATLKVLNNVNEVISGIMLNWIGLYLMNKLLMLAKNPTSNRTIDIITANPSAILPNCGLDRIFGANIYVTIAIPLSIILAVVIMILLNRTVFGYEIKATGYNINAAMYCGMKEKRNLVITMAIAGALAGMGGAFFYLTGYQPWAVTEANIPSMGFDGMSAAFLGGLNPIGVIFSSFFIKHITEGGAYVDRMHYSTQIANLISAVIIYLCGFTGTFQKKITDYLERSVKR